MPAAISADKSREELRAWSQTDPDGLAGYAFDLQTETADADHPLAGVIRSKDRRLELHLWRMETLC
jgi:hypothetical protein